jgi:hypothetical protein
LNVTLVLPELSGKQRSRDKKTPKEAKKQARYIWRMFAG